MKKFLKVFSIAWGVVTSLAFLAMRNCWSGMSGTLGYEKSHSEFILIAPILICVLMFLTLFSEMIIAKAKPDGQKWPVVYFVVQLVYTIVIAVVIIFGGQKYVRFATPHFLKTLGVAAGIFVIWWLIFRYPNLRIKGNNVFKTSVIVVLITLAMLCFVKFGILKFTYEPVVYAVEDEYQIVFSGSTKSIGTVIIDGKEYYDLNAGSEKSSELEHKVIVPMEVLDKAGKYTVTMQHVWYRGPFGGILGGTVSKDYDFRAVDTSDGFEYIGISDVHANALGAIKSTSYASKPDLLVIDGDTLSMIDAYRDANYVNMLAHEITKGEYPVIYARGNHEVKGAYAEQLYKFVGSKNESFYYPVHLGDIYILVLDLGEDHDDDWWEYYDTAHFEDYRAKQMDFIRDEINKGDYKNSSYNMVVAHIPVTFINSRHNHEDDKIALTELLNDMNINMNLCAHQHDIFIFEPGLVNPYVGLEYNPDFKSGSYDGCLTDFNFWSLMLSKPGFTQNPKDDDEASHICLVVDVDFASEKQTCYYLNSLGEKVHIVNQFAPKDYGDEIIIDMK